MDEKTEKKYKFNVNNDLNMMSTEEFFWILEKSGLSQRELGENAVQYLNRQKPYTKQAVNAWGYQWQVGMKGNQIWLLYRSLDSDLFFQYRRMYYDYYVKKHGESPYKEFE